MQSHSGATEISYIAVVDDDESVRRSFSRLLRIAGFQPITYPSAETFLADTKRPQFDCLVLDVQLEGISGLELMQRLTAAKDGTPVIFITAHDSPEVRADAEASGCVRYFRKTDPGAMIVEAIKQAVKSRNAQSDNRAKNQLDCHPTKP